MAHIATLERPPRSDRSNVLGPAIVDAYLARVGVDAANPSVPALMRLHRAHVERVPYETFWLHLDNPWGIDAASSARRIATSTQGGYCFHLNGAFGALLDALGYSVTRHVAGVHDAAGPSMETLGNHVALIVRDLPSDDNPAGEWYADTGLGDALHEPLPLTAGHHRQGPMQLAIEPAAGVGDWHLVNDPTWSMGGVSIIDQPVDIDVFAARHAHNRTAQTSRFRRTVTCQRRHSTGTDVLRGRVLTRRDGSATTTETIESLAHLHTALHGVFGLQLEAPAKALAELWTGMCARHDQWVAGQETAP